MRFPTGDIDYGMAYEPFHPEGLQNQNRLDVFSVSGGSHRDLVRQPLLDWELKAAATPYDNIQELMLEYQLGAQLGEISKVEFVADHVVVVGHGSTVSGTGAKIAVHLAEGLATDNVTLGYRVFSQGRVVTRSMLSGANLKWTLHEGTLRSNATIEIPSAGVLHCVASYSGTAQHHVWIADPSTVQNARRATYDIFDPRLEILNDFITKSQGRGRDARDLEAGVAWLLWMLGFSVAHLGGTQKTQEAADLLATTPQGHFAVIECTTGLLKAENKLALLVERTELVRRRLKESNMHHLRVLPIIVTSKLREDIKADIEQAERLGVLVLTRENMEQAITRTLVMPNADQLYEEAQQRVREGQAKFHEQETLSLPLQ